MSFFMNAKYSGLNWFLLWRNLTFCLRMDRWMGGGMCSRGAGPETVSAPRSLANKYK